MPRAVPVALTVLALASSPLLVGCGGDDEAGAPAATTVPTTAFVPMGPAEPEAGTTTPTVPTPTPAADPDDRAGSTTTTTAPDTPSDPTEQLTPPDAKPPARTPTETTVKRPEDPVFCPGDSAGRGTKAVQRFDTRVLLGLTTAEAAARSKEEGCAMRVVRRDGQDLIRTMDFSNTRVNVTETKGRIVRIVSIG